MELCNKSIISGNNNTMTLPITEDEYKIGVLAWENGAYTIKHCVCFVFN